MFNGIVETLGEVETLLVDKNCMHLCISPQHEFNDLTIGDSIAVNGICLTITDFTSSNFNVTVVPETQRKSNLGELKVGSFVNLERSLLSSARIHGHYVQGHSDGVGKIMNITQDGKDALLIKIAVPKALSKYIVRKGYVSLDGMSITVIETMDDWISITLIPHTRKMTIANHYVLGSTINIEVDILGKYIEKIFGEVKHAPIC